MTIYNVSMSVVDLIEADSKQAAIAKLHQALQKAGFEPYDGVEPEAFESEPVPEEWVRRDGSTDAEWVDLAKRIG